MPFIESTVGVNIHYEEAGAGRPLVFVHGWSMSGRVWRFQAEGLADAYRVITLDLRGHGRSDCPEAGDFGLAALARDVAAVFERLELHGAVLVGWSMGALVALQSFPVIRSRLAGVVLIGGTPRFTSSAEYPHGLAPLEVRGMGTRLRREYQRTMGEFFRGMFAAGELTREQENRIAREIVMGGRLPEPGVAQQTLETLSAADLRELLPSIDLPVLLLHGGRDTICLPDASRYMTERLPRATLKVIEGVGHAPFLSRPHEFNLLLAEFAEKIHVGN